ncbi:hypothetical protein G7Y79_00032g066680 [Physcia stellaris]|nr:hypothetical protein G7Y79_00032g066680 [Physcia stellaris]
MSLSYTTVLTDSGYLPLNDEEVTDISSLPPDAARPQNFSSLQHFSRSWQQSAIQGLTSTTLSLRHQALDKAWKSSSSYSRSRSTIQKLLQHQSLRITNAIFLGLGSLSSQPTPAACERSMAKLVAFESIIRLLREKHPLHPWRIYLQDPCFNDLDREFLASLGYGVLESPASNDYLTEQTFLFAPGNCWDVVFASLKKKFPALLITNPLEGAKPYFYWRPQVEFIKEEFCRTRRVERFRISDAKEGKEDLQVLYYKGDTYSAETEHGNGKEGGVADVNSKSKDPLAQLLTGLKECGLIPGSARLDEKSMLHEGGSDSGCEMCDD